MWCICVLCKWWCLWLERWPASGTLLLAGCDVVGDEERSLRFRFVKLRLNVWPIIQFVHRQNRLDGDSRDSDRKCASRVIHGELFRRRHIGTAAAICTSCTWCLASTAGEQYITRRGIPIGAARSHFFTRWRRESKGKSSWHYRIQSARYIHRLDSWWPKRHPIDDTPVLANSIVVTDSKVVPWYS